MIKDILTRWPLVRQILTHSDGTGVPPEPIAFTFVFAGYNKDRREMVCTGDELHAQKGLSRRTHATNCGWAMRDGSGPTRMLRPLMLGRA
jgi:hypothetical protein